MGDDNGRISEIAAGLRASIDGEAADSPMLDLLAGAVAAIKALQARVEALEGEGFKAMEVLVSAANLPLVRSAAPEASPRQAIVITPDMIHLSNDGFYPVEYTPAGAPYRWTGASGGLFGWSLFLDRSQTRTAVLEVMPQGHAKPQDQDAFLGFLDGNPIRAVRKREGEGLRFEAVLPPAVKKGPTDLRFQAPVWIPKEVRPPSRDERRLGVAILGLTVG